MLPFTADVLFSSFTQYNQHLWPVHIVAFALAVGIIVLALRPIRSGSRVIGALLAIAWLWVGIGYHYLHFTTLDFSAPVYAAFFAFQGVLLIWAAVAQAGVVFRFRPDAFGWTGLAMALVALIAWPMADALAGHGWWSVRLVGLAPAPTTVFTLGLLLLIEGRAPVCLAIIPCSGPWSRAAPPGSSRFPRI